MSDLADFLLARIAEDGAVAQAAADDDPTWCASNEETLDGENVYFTVEGSVDYLFALGAAPIDMHRAHHIARWDPARVLAECDAKRRIVAMLAPPPLPGYAPPSAFGQDFLRLLALPYGDHPDYRDEWRP